MLRDLALLRARLFPGELNSGLREVSLEGMRFAFQVQVSLSSLRSFERVILDIEQQALSGEALFDVSPFGETLEVALVSQHIGVDRLLGVEEVFVFLPLSLQMV